MAASDQLSRYMDYLKLDPNNFNLIKEAANSAYELGRYEEAINLSLKGAELHPEDNGMQNHLALCYLSSGKWSDASDIFQRLVNEGENSPELRYNLAFCLALEDKHREALLLLPDAEDHYLSIPAMAHLKVRALHYIAEIDEAIALGERLLILNPEDAVLHGLLSTLYIDSEDFEQSKIHAEQAIALGSNLKNIDAISSLGTIALSDQDDNKATEYFDKALQLQPKNGRAWLGLGMANMLKNDLNSAEKNFEHALIHMPEHLGTWQILTWCQLAKNELVKAENTLNKSLLIDHNFAESHGVLAIIQLIKGQTDLANESVQRALKLDPQSFSGLYAKSLILQHAGKTDASEKLMQNILDAPLGGNQNSLRSVLIKNVAAKSSIH